MSGARNGVATKILEDERRALYKHCYAHSLNLAVSGTMKKSKVCREALDKWHLRSLASLSSLPKERLHLKKFVQATRMILNFPLQLVFVLSSQPLDRSG